MEASRRSGVGVHLFNFGGSGRVAEAAIVGLGGARGAARDGRRRLAPELQRFLGRRLPRVVRALFVFAPLAEEEQPLVMLPFGVVALLRGPAHLDHFVFAVKNCPKILELGFYVFNCKTGEKENKLGEHFGLTVQGFGVGIRLRPSIGCGLVSAFCF